MNRLRQEEKRGEIDKECAKRERKRGKKEEEKPKFYTPIILPDKSNRQKNIVVRASLARK